MALGCGLEVKNADLGDALLTISIAYLRIITECFPETKIILDYSNGFGFRDILQ